MTGGGGTSEHESALVAQAQAMVADQARCTLDRALELLRNTAEASSESLEFVAEEVVSGRVRFD